MRVFVLFLEAASILHALKQHPPIFNSLLVFLRTFLSPVKSKKNIYLLFSWYERLNGAFSSFGWFGKGFEAGQRRKNDPQVNPPFHQSWGWEVSGVMRSLTAAGKMTLLIPVTETLPTNFQHPIKAFRYATLSHLAGGFHLGLYHGSADWHSGVPPSPSCAGKFPAEEPLLGGISVYPFLLLIRDSSPGSQVPFLLISHS